MRTQMSIIKSFVKLMALAVILIATSMQAAAQTEKSLYERLGGVFAMSAVVDNFSDALGPKCLLAKREKSSPPSQHIKAK